MNKYEALLQQSNKVFHAKDLALLWEISNKNTLNMTLKRFVDRGVLKRIHKGFYATTDLDQIDPYDLGAAYINKYTYLSLESILQKHGVILQDIQYITFVADRTSSFSLNNRQYKVRSLAARFLHNNMGIKRIGNHFQASLERAVADMLYFNAKYYFDNPDKIDWQQVKMMQQEVGFVNS